MANLKKNESEISRYLQEQFKLRNDREKAALLKVVKPLIEEQGSQLTQNELAGSSALEPQGKMDLAMSKQKDVTKKVQNYFEQTLSAFLQPVQEEEQDNVIRNILTLAFMDTHAKGSEAMIEGILNAYQVTKKAEVIFYIEKVFLPNCPNYEDPEKSLRSWMKVLNTGPPTDPPCDMTEKRATLESINLVKYAFITEEWKHGFVEYLRKEFNKGVEKVAESGHYRFDDISVSHFNSESVEIIAEMVLAASPVIPYTGLKDYERPFHSPVSSTTKELMQCGQMAYCSPYLYFYHYGKPTLVKKASVYFTRHAVIASQRTKEPLMAGLDCQMLPVTPKTSEQVCKEVREKFRAYIKDYNGGGERNVYAYMPTLVDNLHGLYETGKSEMKKCLQKIEALASHTNEYKALKRILSHFRTQSPIETRTRSKDASMLDRLLSLWSLDAQPTVNHTPHVNKKASNQSEASSLKLLSISDMDQLGIFCKEEIRSALKKKASSQMDEMQHNLSYVDRPSGDGREIWKKDVPDLVVDMMFVSPPLIPVCSKTKHFPKVFNSTYHKKANEIFCGIPPHSIQHIPNRRWYTPLLMHSNWEVHLKALYQ